ncbi:APO protein 3, mitochondrial-like isoform X2 [Cucumis melo]|uniref:APO protein 3, mitochondrial-like isoform X2 n=1 Tax=Cucumis melo TaxID=3656 RepID=A0ABM3KZR2_CUCME|nr:APO protein 3, mitochondrial-like isoform X2 [Cucumis melo]
MFCRRLLNLVRERELALERFVATSTNSSNRPFVWYSTNRSSAVLLQKPKKSERKPLVTSINELKREARLRKKERQTVEEIPLKPPANGLLVKSLVPVAHEVYAAISELLSCVSTVIKRTVVYYCKVCGDVHIGDPPHKIRTCNVAGSSPNKEHSWEIGGMQHAFPTVESFHLYDRIGRAVSHNEQLEVDRITALVELCIQAGVDIPEYPTRRRTCPAYNVAGRTIDFERRFPKYFTMQKDINTSGFWTERKKTSKDMISISSDDLKGTEKLMEKYAVQTCGYCPEVQVGPKGHRVRNCYAYKHQMRDGQHAWQEATVDDLIPPVYVWHVQDVHSTEPLSDKLKRYYGVLPAVVELFAQAGADTPMRYTSLMKKDVVVPELYEMKLVV